MRMKEEKIGKYTVRWHGIKDESGVLYPPGQLPKEAINTIVNIILKEIAINKENDTS
jgi:hypothetical protein